MYVSSTFIFITNKEGLIWKTVCVLSEYQTKFLKPKWWFQLIFMFNPTWGFIH